MATKIRFQCDCGKELSAPPEWAGKKAKCSRCGNVVRVPQEANGAELATDRANRLSTATTSDSPGPTLPPTDASPSNRTAFCELADQLFPGKASGNTASIWDEEKDLFAPAAASKHCPQCGKPTSGGDAFCAECGASLNAGTAGTAQARPAAAKPNSSFSLGQFLANYSGWVKILIAVAVVGFDFILLKTFRVAGLLFLIPFLVGGLILLLTGLIWAWFLLLKENPKLALGLLFAMVLAAFRLRLRVRGSQGSGEVSYERPKWFLRYGGLFTIIGIAMLMLSVTTGPRGQFRRNVAPQPLQPFQPAPRFGPPHK